MIKWIVLLLLFFVQANGESIRIQVLDDQGAVLSESTENITSDVLTESVASYRDTVKRFDSDADALRQLLIDELASLVQQFPTQAIRDQEEVIRNEREKLEKLRRGRQVQIAR